jgi:membrane protein DedA with SNARE-associated domain
VALVPRREATPTHGAGGPGDELPPRLIFGPLGVLAAANFIGIAFSPYLLVEAPLALIALSPLVRHLVVVAPSVDPLAFFGLATLRLFAPDPFMYALGKRYGPRAVSWIEARSLLAGRFARWLERLFARAGPLVLFVWPGPTVCTVAGVFRMPRQRFVALNLAGTLVLVTLVHHFGAAFRSEIELVQAWVRAHLPLLTSVTAGATLVGWILWRRRARDRLAAVQSGRHG